MHILRASAPSLHRESTNSLINNYCQETTCNGINRLQITVILNCILDCARQRQDPLLDKLLKNSCRQKVGIWIIHVIFILLYQTRGKNLCINIFSYTGPKKEYPWVEHLQGCQRGRWVFLSACFSHKRVPMSCLHQLDALGANSVKFEPIQKIGLK